jgi:hypothetical protein
MCKNSAKARSFGVELVETMCAPPSPPAESTLSMWHMAKYGSMRYITDQVLFLELFGFEFCCCASLAYPVHWLCWIGVGTLD